MSLIIVLQKVKNRIRGKVWKIRRKRINQKNRARFHNPVVSILSMNCTGGILSHDLGLRFRSQTVNLYMRAGDFIQFCENLPYYHSLDEIRICDDPGIVGDRTYPVGWLGDLVLFFVHYSSIEESNRKWQERKKRISLDNIVVIALDRDGMTDELKDRFERLPYHKVLFTAVPDPIHPSAFCIPGYENAGIGRSQRMRAGVARDPSINLIGSVFSTIPGAQISGS